MKSLLVAAILLISQPALADYYGCSPSIRKGDSMSEVAEKCGQPIYTYESMSPDQNVRLLYTVWVFQGHMKEMHVYFLQGEVVDTVKKR